MRAYSFITVLISAFLLLLIQPMLAKMLLPQVGGAPTVWIASMFFFQTMLLAGYGYAALTTHYLSSRLQWLLHMAIFALALAIAIPLSLHLPDFSATQSPIRWVLLSLIATTGLPYFVLSASSSLLQRWYHDATNAEPYFLFSASNAGSFLGLFAYPLLLEWKLDLPQQLIFFSIGFTLLFAFFSGLFLWTRRLKTANHKNQSFKLGTKMAAHASFLAFLPSALFLALTLYITTDIGSFPLLWVIPLALYLLSFVIVFAPWGERWIHHAQKLHVPCIFLFFLSLMSLHAAALLAHLFIFFVIAISCHGQLARIRPAPAKLTAFFFWVSVGGALGGLFNVLSPALFNDIYEYSILIVISPLILPAKRKLQEIIKLPKAEKRKMAGMMALILILAGTVWIDSSPNASDDNLLHKSRNFYGVSKVSKVTLPDDGIIHSYTHGTTLHGLQSQDPVKALTPTSYYMPIYRLIQKFPPSFFSKPFAVLGLGVGTLACYGKEGQRLDFYEINEDVIKIAQDPSFFTYLSDCPPDIRIIEGDGRITLQQQANETGYNLMVMDAFTSASVPMHLLTLEAVKLYTERLNQPDGVLAFNVSNRHYDFKPFLTRIADELGWESYFKIFRSAAASLEISLEWLIMIPKNSPWKPMIEEIGFTPLSAPADTVLWTDDYSYILPAMIWGSRHEEAKAKPAD